MSQQILKISFNNKTRILSKPLPSTYDQLIDRINTLLKLPNDKNIQLYYIDCEEDKIFILSNEDLQAALDEKQNVLKVFVEIQKSFLDFEEDKNDSDSVQMIIQEQVQIPEQKDQVFIREIPFNQEEYQRKQSGENVEIKEPQKDEEKLKEIFSDYFSKEVELFRESLMQKILEDVRIKDHLDSQKQQKQFSQDLESQQINQNNQQFEKKSIQNQITEEKLQNHEQELQNEQNIPENTQQNQQTIHQYIICDQCNMNPIIGIRYKCLECEDYDLCSQCEEKNNHHHPFIKFRQANDSHNLKFINLNQQNIDRFSQRAGDFLKNIVSQQNCNRIFENFPFNQKQNQNSNQESQANQQKSDGKVCNFIEEVQNQLCKNDQNNEEEKEKEKEKQKLLEKNAKKMQDMFGGDLEFYIEYIQNQDPSKNYEQILQDFINM